MRIVLISMLLLTVGCRALSPKPSPQVAVQQAVEAAAANEDQASVNDFTLSPVPEPPSKMQQVIGDKLWCAVWGPPLFVAMIISFAIGDGELL